jgi:hypothetical protein
MLEWIDPSPQVNVEEAEYKRLLGFPRAHVMEGLSQERADQARNWYVQNGRPWIYARQVQSLDITNGSILLDGVPFSSKRLQQSWVQAGADSAVLVAVSAGQELEQQAARAWAEQKPDEYFFLEVFGSAVVEHLITSIGARLCAWADGQSVAVLPHASPGYASWDIGQQIHLFDLIQRGRTGELPGPLEVLDSGMPRPKKSLLAVFGLTRHLDRVARLTDLVPCTNCSYAPCRFRRAPYRRSRIPSEVQSPPAPIATPQPAPIRYTTNLKAIKRWASERLTLEPREDGGIDALFRFEGSTCSNMGRALQFHYHVTLGPKEQGYPIRAQRCEPAPQDQGHRFMCSYLRDPRAIMSAIESEKPLLGRRLAEVLDWKRPLMPTGCYCDPAGRMHKWGLVLETIHYALSTNPLVRSSEANPIQIHSA